MTSTVTYQGALRTSCVHLASGNEIITDEPTDNHGRGAAFSPTDTVATALASCMLTVMGIKANSMDVSLEGTKAEVTKIMSSDPRRISKIIVQIQFAQPTSPKNQQILERTALTCPVHQSLHPDMEKDITFIWP